MKKLLVGSIAAFALTMPLAAQAADLPAAPVYKAPVVAPVTYTWTGCYVSGGVGYGMWNQQNHDETYPGLVPGENVDQTIGGRGWLGRVGAGCDYQINSSFVIGAFADYDFENINGNFGRFNTFESGTEKMSSSWAVGGRVGYLPYANLLTFISAGWTQARFDSVTLSNPNTGVPNDFFNANTYNGWFVGGGYEYRLPWFQNLTWKTEYRFSQFNTADLPLYFVTTGALTGEAEHMQKYVQTVTTSLVWRFNWAGPVVARY